MDEFVSVSPSFVPWIPAWSQTEFTRVLQHAPPMDFDHSTHGDDVTELVTALTDRESRAVLAQFRDASDPVGTVDELADAITANEDKDPELVALWLHHSTLPRLDDAGVTRYDARSNTARYQPRPELETLVASIVQL